MPLHGQESPIRSPGVIALRMCARPRWSAEAEAWLAYDDEARVAWLGVGRIGNGQIGAGNRWALCHMHAARLRAPQDWAQVDRRPAPADLAGPALVS